MPSRLPAIASSRSLEEDVSICRQAALEAERGKLDSYLVPRQRSLEPRPRKMSGSVGDSVQPQRHEAKAMETKSISTRPRLAVCSCFWILSIKELGGTF